MSETLALSRHKLSTFLICQRRFQLRYLARLPWPVTPLDEEAEMALERGQQLHRLLERYFLGLPVDPDAIGDNQVRRWWSLFQESGLSLPNGRLLPELSLTIPIGRHLLTGRFDLLVVGQSGGQDDASGEPFAHIFDWKTGRPTTAAELRQEWQTRLYLAMLAEGGGALWPDGRTLDPDHITLTYWYTAEPEAPRTIGYSQAEHAQNWAEIQELVAQIEVQLAGGQWPLTDDWSHCRLCAYQVYCGRQEAGSATRTADEEEPADDPLQLEPDLP